MWKNALFSIVRMEAAEEVTHSEIGEEDKEEGDHATNVVDDLWFVIFDFWLEQPRPVE